MFMALIAKTDNMQESMGNASRNTGEHHEANRRMELKDKFIPGWAFGIVVKKPRETLASCLRVPGFESVSALLRIPASC